MNTPELDQVIQHLKDKYPDKSDTSFERMVSTCYVQTEEHSYCALTLDGALRLWKASDSNSCVINVGSSAGCDTQQEGKALVDWLKTS